MKNEHHIDGNITTIIMRRRDGSVYKCKVNTHRLPEIEQYRWYVRIVEGKAYVATAPNIYLHRLLSKDTKAQHIDHLDKDTMNNTDDNLIPCSASSNARNRIQANNTSGISGVDWNKSRQVWRVRAKIAGVQKHFGNYKTLEEAAYQATAIRNKLRDIPTRKPIYLK